MTDIPIGDVATIHSPFEVCLSYTFVCVVQSPLQRRSIGCHGDDATAKCLHHVILLDGTSMENNRISTKGRERCDEETNEVFVMGVLDGMSPMVMAFPQSYQGNLRRLKRQKRQNPAGELLSRKPVIVRRKPT